MSRVAFLWVLGSLTLIVGLVALAMFVARRRHNPRSVERVALGRVVARRAPRFVRGQDAGMAPDDGLEQEEGFLEERELPSAAICPECGTRYPEGRRRCSRDAAALQALH